MLLPYATNCYKDGPPRGTIAVILANVLVFASVQMGWIIGEEWTSVWSSWNPVGWLRSAFLHMEWGHLIGNVIGLWIFGQVLEGAVGTRTFSILCLLFVLGIGAYGTLAFHEYPGGAYGASGMVYAILMAACLTAPRTKIHVFCWFVLKPRWLVVRVTMLAAMYIALEVFHSVLFAAHDFTGDVVEEISGIERLRKARPILLNTPGLHLISAAVGTGVAGVGLKLKWIDAGGWDLFSRRHRERSNPGSHRLGNFVMPSPDAKVPAPKADVPTCEHCGRVRPAHKPHCTYCGLLEP